MLTDEQFTDVYKNYRDHTVRLMLKSGFDEATAEDITQDLFELMLRYRTRYNPKFPPHSFWYLMFQYVVYKLIPRYRRNDIAEPMGDPYHHADIAAIPDLNISPEHSMDVVLFVRSLPKIMRHEIEKDIAGFTCMQDRYDMYEGDDKPVSHIAYKKVLTKLRKDPQFNSLMREWLGG